MVMKPLLLLALCALFALSGAIRLETLAQTLGVLQQGDASNASNDSKYTFAVTLSARLRIAELDKRADHTLWKMHGVWESSDSVDPSDEAKFRAKTNGLKYTQEWSDAVKKHNTDASPAHTIEDGRVIRVDPRTVKLPGTILAMPAKLKTGDMGESLVNHEYRNHGYYLPVPVAGFYAILQSSKLDHVKKACAALAAEMDGNRGETRTDTKNGVEVTTIIGVDFINCNAKAYVVVTKTAPVTYTVTFTKASSF